MGKVVFVTGSSSGIGKSTIIQFAKNGYDVVIHYHNHKDEALELSQFVKDNYGVDALVVSGDISKEKDVKMMIEEIFKHFSKIDVLVNNAAIAIDSPLLDKDVDDFRKVLDVNLVGTFLVSKYVAKEMLNKESGSIIFVSSNNAIDSYYPESCDYDASKAGVISLMHNMALELAPFIRVNAVAPGWVDTPMNDFLDAFQRKNECNKILLKRFGNVEEIAKVIYFVAEEGTYINNSVIRVDGGVKNEY